METNPNPGIRKPQGRFKIHTWGADTLRFTGRPSILGAAPVEPESTHGRAASRGSDGQRTHGAHCGAPFRADGGVAARTRWLPGYLAT
jgi:hypothetical protein